MSYNGWSNYETWNVNLWLDNDESLYRDKQHFLRHGLIMPDRVKAFCLEHFPNGTPDMADMGGRKAMEAVDWEELAVAWQAEAAELAS